MKFKRNKGNTITAYNLTSKEIYNLLKLQIDMNFIFVTPVDNQTPVGSFWLFDRVVESNTQCVYFSEKLDGSRSKIVSYEEVVNKLHEFLETSVCTVVFNTIDFKQKLSLLEIVGSIKEDIINGCVFIDYNEGVFSVKNKSNNGLPNELYYWEDTGSLFIFTESGPRTLFESNFNSIEEVICE